MHIPNRKTKKFFIISKFQCTLLIFVRPTISSMCCFPVKNTGNPVKNTGFRSGLQRTELESQKSNPYIGK